MSALRTEFHVSLADSPRALLTQTKGLIHFVITAGNKSFSLDTRDPNGVLVKEGTESETEPDVVLTFPNDAAFLSLVEGKSSPQTVSLGSCALRSASEFCF